MREQHKKRKGKQKLENREREKLTIVRGGDLFSVARLHANELEEGWLRVVADWMQSRYIEGEMNVWKEKKLKKNETLFLFLFVQQLGGGDCLCVLNFLLLHTNRGKRRSGKGSLMIFYIPIFIYKRTTSQSLNKTHWCVDIRSHWISCPFGVDEKTSEEIKQRK